MLVEEVTQNFSEAVDRFKSGVERLVWSRAIDQCAMCVVVVKKIFFIFSPMFTVLLTSAPPDCLRLGHVVVGNGNVFQGDRMS